MLHSSILIPSGTAEASYIPIPTSIKEGDTVPARSLSVVTTVIEAPASVVNSLSMQESFSVYGATKPMF